MVKDPEIKEVDENIVTMNGVNSIIIKPDVTVDINISGLTTNFAIENKVYWILKHPGVELQRAILETTPFLDHKIGAFFI